MPDFKFKTEGRGKMKKRILCTAAYAAVWGACLMFAAAAATHYPVIQAMAVVHTETTDKENGLVKENGAFCYYEYGQPVKERWITADGHTYYFDAYGNVSVLKCKIEGDYYVFDKEGRLLLPSRKKVVRVETPEGEFRTYYVDTEGKAASGWSPDKKYYFDKTGEPVTGITVIKEKFYCFSKNGRLNQAKTQKIRKAAKYGQPFSSLEKYIGNPEKSKYFDSCYGAGKDGILSYGSFKVYTFKPDKGEEIFMGAE